MSDFAEIIDTLEDRIEKLLVKMNQFEQTILQQRTQLQEAVTMMQKQSDEIQALKEQQEALKFANSLLGSNETKRDTKLKINSLIREIDYCIAQLSD